MTGTEHDCSDRAPSAATADTAPATGTSIQQLLRGARGLHMKHGGMIAVTAMLVVTACILGYVHDLNGDSLDLSDTRVMVVVSGSMDGEPRKGYDIDTVPTGSLIVIREVPSGTSEGDRFYASLGVGDVLTFHYTHPVSRQDMVVTHRIVDIKSTGSSYTYTLKGDSVADDPTNGSVQVVTSDSGDVIGKVVGVSPFLGKLVTFVSTDLGKVVLVLVPCLVLIVTESRSIVRSVRSMVQGGEGPETDQQQSSQTSAGDRSPPVCTVAATVPGPEARGTRPGWDGTLSERIFRRLE